MKKAIVLLLCAVLLAGLIFGAMQVTKKEGEVPIENAGISQNAVVKPKTLTYKGQEYPMKPHIQTVLLIGTDSVEAYEEKTDGVIPFYNRHQADFLMLLVLDTKADTAEILQINRDTMTDVPWLDVLGDYGGTEFKQLCLAYNYGDGGIKSCKNTMNAVSSLLFDAPIDSYIQIPMSAIPVLNDLVGGVPVTIAEDMTAVDPEFAAGATIWLNGEQAERFIRARKTLEIDTNLARMERQRQYLDSFQRQAKKAFNSDSHFMIKMLEKLSEYLQSNLTAQQLSDLVTRLDKSQISPIRFAEGELKKGEEYYEFYPDEASLWEMVRNAYCTDGKN